MTPEPAALLLITVDSVGVADERGLVKVRPALEIARERLVAALWPIFQNTKYKAHMVPGRHLLFYIGGAGQLARHIVAHADIAKVLHPSHLPRHLRSPYAPATSTVLQLRNIKEFERPIDLRAHRDALSFLRDAGPHWGLRLQGGCVPLTTDDIKALS